MSPVRDCCILMLENFILMTNKTEKITELNKIKENINMTTEEQNIINSLIHKNQNSIDFLHSEIKNNQICCHIQQKIYMKSNEEGYIGKIDNSKNDMEDIKHIMTNWYIP